MKAMASWYLLVTLCVASVPAIQGATVKSGSAYSGLTVAIHKNVPFDMELIDILKEQFTSASRLLYQATDGWAYFKDIVISVPNTWQSSVAFTKVYSDPYPHAEIRIEEANGAYGDTPYTMQPGGCTEPGEYVHLTPNFVLQSDEAIKENYGPRERVLVHEWSHLRYGIFDEYGIPGDKKFPLFYFQNGLMEVSFCSEDVAGWMESDKGSICTVFEDHVTSDCVFIPDMDNTATRNSLMSLNYLPSVDRFCTKDNATGTIHNWRAPTKQNLLCNGRSAWEVISSHPDFTTQRNTGEAFQPPNFRVVRTEILPQRYVLVLDVSGSMSGAPLSLMKQTTDWFVRDLIKPNSYIGVVTFHSRASLIQSVVKLDNAMKGIVQGRIQSMVASGGTSIGSGVKLAIEALQSAGLVTEDATLLVITDGGENSNPVINDIIPLVKQTKVKIMAISFGRAASQDMEKLAAVSGGTSFLFQNIQGTSTADLDQIFITATSTQSDTDVQFVQLLNKPFVVTPAVSVTTATLDPELGKNVVFTLSGQVGQVDMELESPSGRKYIASSSEFTREASRLQYKFPVAESGKWKVTFRSRGGTSTVDFSLISEPKNPAEHPIKAKSWISGGEIKTQAGQLPKVYASVSKGPDMVIRAVVKALVVSDTGREVTIDLRDDGAGVDAIADDGIYTGVFTQFRANEKRYAVTAEVINRGQAIIKSAKQSRAPILLRRKPRVTPKTPPSTKFTLNQFQVLDKDPDADVPIGEKAGDFDRSTNGGSFIVKDFTGNQKDIIKPSSVTDLAVIRTGENKNGQKYIVLVWTAPGDDMDSGTPAKLEIRMSLVGDIFLKDFSSGQLLDSTHVQEGSLTPQVGGTKQEITVTVPKELLEKTVPNKPLDIYMMVRATDKAGNVGEQGKMAIAHFGYEIPICIQKSGQYPKARACNQFYHCSNGTPYLKNCPANLHYSAQRGRCEWPCSAKCDPKMQCAP